MNSKPSMTNNIDILESLSFCERLKYLRKVILKQNQNDFCSDGTLGISTLKGIERGAYGISTKINDKLLEKFAKQGIYLNEDFFVNSGNVTVTINSDILTSLQELNDEIEQYHENIHRLRPIKITTNNFLPFIRKDSLLFVEPQEIEDYTKLCNTLCLVDGKKEIKVFFLSYHAKDNNIKAVYSDNTTYFSTEFIQICPVHVVQGVSYAANAL